MKIYTKNQIKLVLEMIQVSLNLTKLIAETAHLTTFDEVRDYILNMDPDELAALQVPLSILSVTELEYIYEKV